MRTAAPSSGPRAAAAAAAGPDRRLYRAGEIGAGAFRCPPSFPGFADTGPTGGHLLVFPRTAVAITHEGGVPMVADATRVMLYNRGQRYTRALRDPRGDRCDWFSVPAAAIVDAALPFDPAAADRQDRPFAFSVALTDARTYLDQRLLFESLRRAPRPDPLYVEEAVLGLLSRVVASAYRSRGIHPRPHRTPTERLQAGVVDAVQSLLSAAADRTPTLDELAARVGVSPYHLCRIFRRRTGLSVHQYLTQLRVRAALERIAGNPRDLTSLGLDLGYSSHSHFTESFRSAFGLTPSRLRAVWHGCR